MIEVMVQLLVFSGSLGLLALASHFTISSLERLIEMTGLSETSAGIVVFAVLTATPEITVALFSVLEGTPGVSVGDVLGSNIFNIGVVIGILGMLGFLTKFRGGHDNLGGASPVPADTDCNILAVPVKRRSFASRRHNPHHDIHTLPSYNLITRTLLLVIRCVCYGFAC